MVKFKRIFMCTFICAFMVDTFDKIYILGKNQCLVIKIKKVFFQQELLKK